MSEVVFTLVTEVSRSVITAAAVYFIIIGLAGLMGLRRSWHESVEAVGGFLWVLGLTLWRAQEPADNYTASLALRSWGVALMLLPWLVRAALRGRYERG